MRNSARSRAEDQFAAIQKKAKKALNEKERARQAISERMAKQRALRLAREAEIKAVAEKANAETDAAEKKSAEKGDAELSKSSRLPEVHRR